MSEESYISDLKRKNWDLFSADKIKISPDSLEKILRQAFREGAKDALDLKSESTHVDMPPFMKEFFQK